MDAERFDRLARRVAANHNQSRRETIRGLGSLAIAMLALARGGRAQAMQYAGPGEPCWTEEQCRAASGALYCADNGFGYTACCAGEGDRCARDDGCCGAMSCIGGACGYFGPGPGVGLPLGSSCASVYDCADGGYGIECRGVCCLSNGQGCGTDSDCCGSDRCVYANYQQGSLCMQSYGGPCFSDQGCEGPLACVGGFCR